MLTTIHIHYMQHANVSNKHKAQNVSIAEADKITVKLIKDS